MKLFAAFALVVGLLTGAFSNASDAVGSRRALTDLEREQLKVSLAIVAASDFKACTATTVNSNPKAVVSNFADFSVNSRLSDDLNAVISSSQTERMLAAGVLTKVAPDRFTISYTQALNLEVLEPRKFGSTQVTHQFQIVQHMLLWLSSQASVGGKTRVVCQAKQKFDPSSIGVASGKVHTLEYRMGKNEAVRTQPDMNARPLDRAQSVDTQD